MQHKISKARGNWKWNENKEDSNRIVMEQRKNAIWEEFKLPWGIWNQKSEKRETMRGRERERGVRMLYNDAIWEWWGGSFIARRPERGVPELFACFGSNNYGTLAGRIWLVLKLFGLWKLPTLSGLQNDSILCENYT